MAASPLASRLAGRVGRRRTAVFGLLAQAAGLLVAGLAGAGWLLVAFVLVGLGAPLAFVPATSSAMRASGEEAGVVSGLFNTVQQVGNALALALVATAAAVAAGGGEPDRATLSAGHRAGFLLAAVLAAAALPAAARLPASAASRSGEGA